MFNAEKVTNDIVKWIIEQKNNTGAKGFVLGISGGKDSATVAGLLCKAVGKENVLGVMMPNGNQIDIEDSKAVCTALGIKNITININDAYNGLVAQLDYACDLKNPESKINISPRLRMTTLYSLGQEYGYLVCGTGNRSEAHIGYCTKWGDAACDLNPIANLTTDEVIAIGDFLGLPHEITHKAPTDGLSGLTDEEKIGFTYSDLNKYITEGICENETIKRSIDDRHEKSRHKFALPPTFEV